MAVNVRGCFVGSQTAPGVAHYITPKHAVVGVM